jgi:adenine-specific DNA-methyltransferase
MPKSRKNDSKRPIESYEHRDKQRVNNPPVGLVNPDTDPYAGVKKGYAYDPHLDPQVQWAGKAEHTSFEVPTFRCMCMKGLGGVRGESRRLCTRVCRQDGFLTGRPPALFGAFCVNARGKPAIAHLSEAFPSEAGADGLWHV